MQTFNAMFGLSKMSARRIRSICETRATFRVACVQVFGKKLPTFKDAAEDFAIFSAFIDSWIRIGAFSMSVLCSKRHESGRVLEHDLRLFVRG